MWSFFSKDPSKDLNYELQECISSGFLEDKTIWTIYNGKKKGTTNDLVTVFAYQAKQGNESLLPYAKNGFKRMKILRHPNILLFADGLESDKALFVVTERVKPLITYLNESTDNESQKENEISWGLHQVATGLSFINNDCKLVHNNINLSSIFVNKAGEWKLGALEFIGDNLSETTTKILNALSKYEPAERLNKAMAGELWSVDSWGLGCLIWEIFNGELTNINALKNYGKIAKRLIPTYSELMNANSRNRLNPSKFIEKCRHHNGFMDNHFVDTLLFLERIQIKDQNEKTKFFSELTEKLDDFPHNLCLYLILPQLINAFEFGNAGSSILAPLFKLGKMLDTNEYQKKIIPIVVKLFSSTDRTTRMRLLQQIDSFIEHITANVINEQIFTNICQGFCDSSPAIRESTIRAMVYLAPKLNYNNLNIELMKHFARLQGTDDQGMIRTNTTVCIGKIAPYINPQLRQRILLSAFPKAMRDPFAACRLSGIIAFANTDRFYTLRDIASKVLPCLCLACIDPDIDVRNEALKTIKQFLNKLEKVSDNPELAIEFEKDVNSCTLDVKNETSWTSWAMTSLSAKLTDYKNKGQQPSVSLSTTSDSKKVIEPSNNKQNENNTNDSDKKLTTKSINKTEIEKTDKQNPIIKPSDSWDYDNEWKEIEDDDNYEPMDPLGSENYFSSKSTSSSMQLSTKPKSTDDDWNNWGLDSNKDNRSVPSSTTTSSATSNWSKNAATNAFKNEEDLFNSLVKDISIKNTSKQQNDEKFINDEWQDWENDVSSNRKSDRNERNASKTKEQSAKRQSKPLKLGAKKLNE